MSQNACQPLIAPDIHDFAVITCQTTLTVMACSLILLVVHKLRVCPWSHIRMRPCSAQVNVQRASAWSVECPHPRSVLSKTLHHLVRSNAGGNCTATHPAESILHSCADHALVLECSDCGAFACTGCCRRTLSRSSPMSASGSSFCRFATACCQTLPSWLFAPSHQTLESLAAWPTTSSCTGRQATC